MIWGGQLVSVTLPFDAENWSERGRWCFVQMRATGADEGTALRAALATELPGLGYGAPTTRPLPFSYAVCGRGHADAGVEFDKSSPSLQSNTDSRKPRPRVPSHAEKHGVSDTAALRKPPPQSSTSSASRPRGPTAAGADPRRASQRPMQTARPHTGGWMGRAATKQPASVASPHA